MKTKTFRTHPVLLFWIGVLTGAILVGLTFLYRLYAIDTEAALLRATTLTPTLSTSLTTSNVQYDGPTPWMPTATTKSLLTTKK